MGPIIPTLPVYPAIASGLPDPGSRPGNCASLDGIETAPWMATFEPLPQDPSPVGVAIAWAAFDDLTRYAFHVPGDVTWYRGITGYSAPWGLPSDAVGGPSCDGLPNQWSLHFRGGLFRKWGGGVSHVFTDPDPCPPGAGFCSAQADPTLGSAGLPSSPPAGGAYAQSHAYVDASSYDGVAFWARRGPEGQDRMLVTVTDNFTSDRLARQNQTYCRRLRQCYTRCLSGTPCSLDPTGVYRCFDPQAGPLPDIASVSAPIPALFDLLYPRCGKSACTSPDTYPDPDFDGKDCRPYTFPAADESGEYCFNEGDPPPPSRDDRCLDGWATSVQLTMDWLHYAVAFSELGQGGFGKKAPYFNLKAIDTIAFGFIVGWADAYVDDVTFYRRKK